MDFGDLGGNSVRRAQPLLDLGLVHHFDCEGVTESQGLDSMGDEVVEQHEGADSVEDVMVRAQD
jgi:hypothetical protein